MRSPYLCACAFVLVGGCGDPPEPAPTVAVAREVRGGFELEREDHVTPVSGPTRVEQNSLARTLDDGRGILRLDTGGWVLLDRTTAVSVELGELEVRRGRVWIDVKDASELEVRSAHGGIRATGATVAVEVKEGQTHVYCGSGEVTYRAQDGEGRLQQGETLALGAESPRVVPEALWADWTGGLADPTPDPTVAPAYIGVLAGRTLQETGRARRSLPIRSHDVFAAIRDDLAETVVTQTFFNARSEVLEAEYTIEVPAGAIVQTFAVDSGSGFVTGTVGTLGNEQGYELSWMDSSAASSRLSYDGPGRYRARIHPVAPGATIRIQLTYTEWLDRTGATRTYVYPMESGRAAPLIGEFVLEVDATGAAVGATRAGMGAQVDQARVVLRKSDFRPLADFYLDLIDVEAQEEGVVRAHVVGSGTEGAAEGDERYVLINIPTDEFVEQEEDAQSIREPIELVLVVDLSGATEPENVELASRVTETLLRQLSPADRVTIRFADVTAHRPQNVPEGLREATGEAQEAIIESLARAQAGGATDLAAVLREAALLVAGRPRGAVVYLGDGIPTTGAVDATSIGTVLSSVEAPPQYFAFAVGDGANHDLLRALFGRNAFAVRERAEAIHAVMAVVAQAARPSYRGVHVELGEAVERIYPRSPVEFFKGKHVRFVGRLRGDLPQSLRVRGTYEGRAFDRTLPIKAVQINDGGDIRRRWSVGRLNELLDEDAGREALVELGVRFGLVTPFTALVVGASAGQPYAPITGFDIDPVDVAWSIGGRGRAQSVAALGAGGWRRRTRRPATELDVVPERTWPQRTTAQASGGDDQPSDDGGLARAAVEGAFARRASVARGCWERELRVRPDLGGLVRVTLSVDGAGEIKESAVVQSTLSAAHVDACILNEVRGIRFPATGSAAVTSIAHTFRFEMATRALGTRTSCSDASQQPLTVRSALWRERLAANAGVRGALSVWHQARGQCETRGFRAQRTLLRLILRHLGGVSAQVRFYRSFGAQSAVGQWLRQAIVRNVRTANDVAVVRAGLGFEVPVNWSVFARRWRATSDPAKRLALVRRWLEVAPDEMDLRLKLLALLEEQNVSEARTLARELRADPLADARVRTAIGEFWLRQGDELSARRVFSEIVEHAPFDPWARKRLGDLYRAHNWADDAYREYRMLARIRPADGAVLLDLARAAAAAGRIDEALRLEQRLSETADGATRTGAAVFARVWTQVRLARLKAGTDPELGVLIRRRERQTGALRSPPALIAALTWAHPDDAPQLALRHPGDDGDPVPFERVTLRGGHHGVEAELLTELEPGEYRFEVTRLDRDELRDLEAELIVVVSLGTSDEVVIRHPVRLTRQQRRIRLRLADGALHPVPGSPTQ